LRVDPDPRNNLYRVTEGTRSGHAGKICRLTKANRRKSGIQLLTKKNENADSTDINAHDQLRLRKSSQADPKTRIQIGNGNLSAVTQDFLESIPYEDEDVGNAEGTASGAAASSED